MSPVRSLQKVETMSGQIAVRSGSTQTGGPCKVDYEPTRADKVTIARVVDRAIIGECMKKTSRLIQRMLAVKIENGFDVSFMKIATFKIWVVALGVHNLAPDIKMGGQIKGRSGVAVAKQLSCPIG